MSDSESEWGSAKVYFTPTTADGLAWILSCLVLVRRARQGKAGRARLAGTTRARLAMLRLGLTPLQCAPPHVPSKLRPPYVAPCPLELIAVTVLHFLPPAHRVTWAPPSKHTGIVRYGAVTENVSFVSSVCSLCQPAPVAASGVWW